MAERLLIAAALLLAAYLVYCFVRTRQLAQAARMAPMDPLLTPLRPGIPAIVYFTTPTCAPCRYQQRPALARLHETLGADGVQIVEVDAAAQPDAAARWGVFTAPTTFVLDAQFRPHSVNHDVADTATLIRQVQAAVQAA